MPHLSRAAWRYLIHAALLTFGLAISGLFFNLALAELGYAERTVALPLLGPVALLGLLNGLPVLVAALSSLPLWWLVNRVGPQAALVVSALLHAASLLIIALWPTPGPLLAGVALGGPASVLFQISAAPLMMRLSDARSRDTLFALSAGVNIAVAGLGALAGGFVPGLARQLLDLPDGGALAYRAAFVVAAACVALAALPLLTREGGGGGPAEGEAGPHPPARRPLDLRFILRSSLFALRFIMSPLLISTGAALLIPFLPLYFRGRFGAPDATLGLIFAAVSVATGLATFAAPALSARLGKMASVVITQSLAIPCLLLLGLAPALWVAAAVAVARGSLMNMAAPLYDAYAMERSPEPARPLVIGLINGAFSAGYIIGPTISVEVQRSYGFTPLFLATAACYSLAALANYLLFLRKGRA